MQSRRDSLVEFFGAIASRVGFFVHTFHRVRWLTIGIATLAIVAIAYGGAILSVRISEFQADYAPYDNYWWYCPTEISLGEECIGYQQCEDGRYIEEGNNCSAVRCWDGSSAESVWYCPDPENPSDPNDPPGDGGDGGGGGPPSFEEPGPPPPSFGGEPITCEETYRSCNGEGGRDYVYQHYSNCNGENLRPACEYGCSNGACNPPSQAPAPGSFSWDLSRSTNECSFSKFGDQENTDPLSSCSNIFAGGLLDNTTGKTVNLKFYADHVPTAGWSRNNSEPGTTWAEGFDRGETHFGDGIDQRWRISYNTSAYNCGRIVQGAEWLIDGEGTGEGFNVVFNYGRSCSQTTPTPTLTPQPTVTPLPSTCTALPAPNHPIELAYYFSDGRYGDAYSEVSGFTNTYHAWVRRGYETSSEESDDVWLPKMEAGVRRAFQDNKHIYLALGMERDQVTSATTDRVLDMMRPYWSKVTRIELADEPNWTRAQTEERIRDIRSKLTVRNLPSRQIGVVYTNNQLMQQDMLFSDGLDWVGIEAYIDPPGSSASSTNVSALSAFLSQAKQRVPSSKDIVIVMMAYARNGAWTNLATLKDLQTPAYYAAYNDPRVKAITMFSYGRPSGTREHGDTLRAVHQAIGYKILGIPCSGTTPTPTPTRIPTPTIHPSATPGPQTLTCTPSSRVITPGQEITLTATGGNGSYQWSAPRAITAAGTGATFSTRYSLAVQPLLCPVSSDTLAIFNPELLAPTCLDQHTITVRSGGETTSCLVLVAPEPIPNQISPSPTISVQPTNPPATPTPTSSPTVTPTTTPAATPTPFASPSVQVSPSISPSPTTLVNISPQVAPLTCTPLSQTITQGQAANIFATGGTGAYAWSASSSTPRTGGASVFRTTPDTTGTHVVTVVSGGTSQACTIVVQRQSTQTNTEALACEPLSQSISMGDDALIRARGGSGTYTWNSGAGIPSSGSGAAFTTRFQVSGARSVTVSDGVTSAVCGVTVRQSTTQTSNTTPQADSLSLAVGFREPEASGAFTNTLARAPGQDASMRILVETQSLAPLSNATLILTLPSTVSISPNSLRTSAGTIEGRTIRIGNISGTRTIEILGTLSIAAESAFSIGSTIIPVTASLTSDSHGRITHAGTLTVFRASSQAINPNEQHNNITTSSSTPVIAISLQGRNLSRGAAQLTQETRAAQGETLELALLVRAMNATTNTTTTITLPEYLTFVPGTLSINGAQDTNADIKRTVALGSLRAGDTISVRFSVRTAAQVGIGSQALITRATVQASGLPSVQTEHATILLGGGLRDASTVSTGVAESLLIALGGAFIIAGTWLGVTRLRKWRAREARALATQSSIFNFATAPLTLVLLGIASIAITPPGDIDFSGSRAANVIECSIENDGSITCTLPPENK